ncbi:hypothetical protein MJD09_07490 [bacterium]|nr:hypothetical protein [bacterium]
MKIFINFAVGLAIVFSLFSCEEKQKHYVCPPCNSSCDNLKFSSAGECPHCQMQLIKQGTINETEGLVVNKINIQTGSGVFLIEGGVGHHEKLIKVYYHKPKTFQTQSRILIVVPGSGRNGDSYRDSWKEDSEKYGMLILAPMYPESEYGFGDYHFGGLMYDLTLEESVTYVENSNQVILDEESFSFRVNANADEWIFNDFDRLFESVVTAIGSEQTEYDIFGHSAGGQILHRFTIFLPNSKADRIVASNSGFYTLLDFSSELPFGVKNTPLTEAKLESSFKKQLVLFIGELDSEDEKGGILLRSPTVDKQGLHRLARGRFFYNKAKTMADKLGFDFNWELVIIPNVGHNHKEMGNAAAEFLYEGNSS